MVSDPVREAEGGGDNVHLSVADEDVAVGPEALDALVLVYVLVVGIEEVTVADDEVEDWIAVAVRLLGVAAEDVVDGAAVVEARGRLAVAVEAGVPARVGKSFQLEAVGVLDQAEVRVTVAPGSKRRPVARRRFTNQFWK